ncbi:MAG: hypothetical protein RIT81_23795 [Deltaproteobacteria bacterium]
MVERLGPNAVLGVDPSELERVMEKREEERQEITPLIAFDRFERHLQQANQYASQGKSVEAGAELDEAHRYLNEVEDQKLRDELHIRLTQARNQFPR